MNFREISPELQQAVKELTGDKVFQERFGHDEVLDELDDEKFDPSKSFKELQAVYGNSLHFKGRRYKQVTLKLWSFLWSIESPLIRASKGTVNEADFDIFFYILDNGVQDEPLESIFKKSMGYVRTLGISPAEASSIYSTLTATAFSALNMFPENRANVTVGKTEAVFDADWITGIASKVAQASGIDVMRVIDKLSMCACCFYYAQWARQNGAKYIERRPSEEILKLQDARGCELIADRLIELGKLSAEEREEFIKKIITHDNK